MSEGIRKYEIMDRLDMQQQLQALRDEVARLRGIMEEAASAPGKDWLEWQLKLGAALTPQGGGKSCAHPRTQWYSGQYEKTLECLDCRVELDERKLR